MTSTSSFHVVQNKPGLLLVKLRKIVDNIQQQPRVENESLRHSVPIFVALFQLRLDESQIIYAVCFLTNRPSCTRSEIFPCDKQHLCRDELA
ncbi:hypothetical protein Zmor_019562 [Zophobas morio]|uniref:Uncharacterized protein n=1 Tax=Zophobas morio TaxID=2755281 RepID=A0AA38HZX0_9CUCU|nr:hypothetical protein Zmor_019562 [Zophobas morio]